MTELRIKAEVDNFKYPNDEELKKDFENIVLLRHWEKESTKVARSSNVITSHTHKVRELFLHILTNFRSPIFFLTYFITMIIWHSKNRFEHWTVLIFFYYIVRLMYKLLERQRQHKMLYKLQYFSFLLINILYVNIITKSY